MTDIALPLWLAGSYILAPVLDWTKAPTWLRLIAALTFMVADPIAWYFSVTINVPSAIGTPLAYGLIFFVVIAAVLPLIKYRKAALEQAKRATY